MSDSVKNNEYLNELIRYKNNKMSNQERHLFERALERDPFLEEALEGFLEFKTSDIEKDLASIDLVSGKRKIKINPAIFYSVVVVILVLVVSVFIVKLIPHNRNKVDSNETVQDQNQALVFNDSTYKQSESTGYNGQADSIPLLVAPNQQMNAQAKDAANTSTVSPNSVKLGEGDPSAAKKSIPDSNNNRKPEVKKPTVVTAVQAKNNSGATESDKTPPVQPELVNEPVSENGKKSAESETVASTELTEPQQNIRHGVNAKPEPLGGFDLFKNYIDKNLTYPETETDGSREVVKVQFTVSKTGQLTNFSVDKAPENSDFTTEAIRLLKNGPKWAPAVKNGVPVEEVVNYRIVFKP